MSSQREIDKLVEILGKQVGKYNEKQIKGAILAEGYEEDVALQVLDKLFPKQAKPETVVEIKPLKEEPKPTEQPKETQRPTRPNVQKQEIVPETKVDVEKQDYYTEVNYLLNQLKTLNTIKKPEIQTPNLIKQDPIVTQTNTITKPNGDVNAQIELKKQELQKIKIENDDDTKIILNDGKIINLNDYPRREWRNYRDNGKTIAESKEEQIQKLRNDIYALKRQSGRGNEVIQEENISQKIKERVKQRSHGRIPENKLDLASRDEAEKLREKYKDAEVERQDLDTAADNIYIQMMKNPNIYGDEPNTEDNKTDKQINNKNTGNKQDEKKKENKTNELNTDEFNLDSNFSLDSSNIDNNNNSNDLGNEFDLGLNLDDDKDKKKKK